MIHNTSSLQRLWFNIVLSIPSICIAIICYWAFVNTFLPTTELLKPMPNKSEYRVDELVVVDSTVRRYRSCIIDITRILENEATRREFQVQRVTQFIEADDPVFDRPNGYTFQIPHELATGYYNIFTRVRYFCNGLDYVFARHMTTPKARIHVTGAV